MPTAPKLVAAIWFALLAWFAAELAKMHLPESSFVGKMSLISAAFGFLVGWIFTGKRAGDTMRAAYGYGLTSVLLLLFWCVLYFSVEQMLMRAWNGRYKGPMHALSGGVDLFREYVLIAIRPDVALTLIVGGFFGGWLVEKSARRWS